VRIHGQVVHLTRIEYDVLEHLATRLSRVCAREEMVLAIWSSALTHDHHLVDVHVANLRGKLRHHSDSVWIHTMRGIGYRLDPAGEPASPTADGRPILGAGYEHRTEARGAER
jgi:DNA-binding response OmpR family regulator